ncbi:GNAT family N-acetyltransferase [Luteolibacter flavescens]|uniref:GNAT family N-acetyltransferase n=1 Tax=Luteolibacter flavescens TaxID=1859460 RepID=A0ABT3FIY5_9BACT|nr:GNAT family N-acetyltransferase [Luteolibacter flavescens]MCW1883319.1 GNAT family N-acetyltransferase [Luteolibacter flavescens]
MKFETDRLILKPPAAEDIGAIVAVANDPWIAEMTLMPHPYLQRDALAWIAKAKEDWESHGHGGLAIFTRTGMAFAGAIGLKATEAPGVCSVGYWLSPAVWGRGFATEALREMLRYGFEVVGLQKIEACHVIENPASGKVMEKAGLIHATPEDLPARDGQGMVPGIVRHITADEWRATQFASTP